MWRRLGLGWIAALRHGDKSHARSSQPAFGGLGSDSVYYGARLSASGDTVGTVSGGLRELGGYQSGGIGVRHPGHSGRGEFRNPRISPEDHSISGLVGRVWPVGGPTKGAGHHGDDLDSHADLRILDLFDWP